MTELLNTAHPEWWASEGTTPPPEWDVTAGAIHFLLATELKYIGPAVQAGDTVTLNVAMVNGGFGPTGWPAAYYTINDAKTYLDQIASATATVTLAAGDAFSFFAAGAVGYQTDLTLTPEVGAADPEPPAPVHDDCDTPVIELWPPPDAAYTVRIRAYPVARVFGAPKDDGSYNDAQTTQCDARAVFLMALANAKAHYGKQDAQVAANELNSLLGRLRAGRHGNYRYGVDEHAPRRSELHAPPKWVK